MKYLITLLLLPIISYNIFAQTFGKVYEKACHIHWCNNIINVFDFHSPYMVQMLYFHASTLIFTHRGKVF